MFYACEAPVGGPDLQDQFAERVLHKREKCADRSIEFRLRSLLGIEQRNEY